MEGIFPQESSSLRSSSLPEPQPLITEQSVIITEPPRITQPQRITNSQPLVIKGRRHGPVPRTLGEKIAGFRNRYGVQFIKDLKRLKRQPYWNLSSMGAKYGYSRELVRQVFKTVYNESITTYERIKAAMVREEVQGVGCRFDPRQKMELALIESKIKRAESQTAQAARTKILNIQAKAAIFSECKARGIPVEPHPDQYSWLVINGHAVAIRCAAAAHRVNTHAETHNRYFHTNLLGDLIQKGAEFLIFYIMPTNTFWIFPKEFLVGKTLLSIPQHQSKMKHDRTIMPRISPFRDAWGLLR
jgi:hypothetical protein